MFRLRPYYGLLLAALFVLMAGGLLTAYFYMEDSYVSGRSRWLLTAVCTAVASGLLIVAAFSRYGFRHLRHHRTGYKRG
jgi:4-amino-4-deoxy-L-arabinose transferase-like glycosyltransferase